MGGTPAQRERKNIDGNGGFTGADLGAVPTTWTIVGVADFNGDGRADILWRNTNGDTYLYLSTGAGAFSGLDIGVVT